MIQNLLTKFSRDHRAQERKLQSLEKALLAELSSDPRFTGIAAVPAGLLESEGDVDSGDDESPMPSKTAGLLGGGATAAAPLATRGDDSDEDDSDGDSAPKASASRMPQTKQ